MVTQWGDVSWCALAQWGAGVVMSEPHSRPFKHAPSWIFLRSKARGLANKEALRKQKELQCDAALPLRFVTLILGKLQLDVWVRQTWDESCPPERQREGDPIPPTSISCSSNPIPFLTSCPFQVPFQPSCPTSFTMLLLLLPSARASRPRTSVSLHPISFLSSQAPRWCKWGRPQTLAQLTSQPLSNPIRKRILCFGRPQGPLG